MIKSVNVKKTKKFKENRPENYHVHDMYDGETVALKGLRLSQDDPDAQMAKQVSMLYNPQREFYRHCADIW